MDAIRRHPVVFAILGFVLLLFMMTSVSIVPETRQGVVAQFGKPVRIINRYKAGDRFGGVGAGLAFRVPFLESIVWIDKRVRDLDMEQQVLSTDQRRLSRCSRYRSIRSACILPPDRSAGSSWRLSRSLVPARNSGKRPFASLLSPEREGAMGIFAAAWIVGAPIWRRDCRRADQGRPAERTARVLMTDADGPAGGEIDCRHEAKDAQSLRARTMPTRRASTPPHSRTRNSTILPRHAVLQRHSAGRAGQGQADQHHPVAKQISEGIYWT
jgi:membrane protease subunit HflC